MAAILGIDSKKRKISKVWLHGYGKYHAEPRI
nr:MAG TPA: hypothetical protein [Caudoviricetes sp.]